MWRDIIGYEGIYSISEYGDILINATGKLKKIWITNKGYKCVDLYKDGKVKHKLIHRLVAEVFVPNPNNYPIVLHLDNNKLNTHFTNLIWGTYSENNSQAIRDGLNKVPRPDNRRYYNITNGNNSIICYGSSEVIDKIGYGNKGIIYNLANRHDRIKCGPYKNYYVERVYNKEMIKPIST